jgi:serine/threonine-protein kinase
LCIEIGRGDFPPPSSLVPSLPATLDRWFLRVLVRDPAARFDSAKEMSRAFAFAVAGRDFQ